MTFADLVTTSAGNLWRMKLRSFLTISGVVIAIAAFVAMLSFGAGNQQYVTDRFNQLGLLTMMQVYPPRTEEGERPDTMAVLDEAAVERLSQIPGVRLAYPFDAFSVTVGLADTQLAVDAQALPAEAADTRLYSQLAAGEAFRTDSARKVLVTQDLLKDAGIENADSAIGQPIVISARLATLDSGIVNVFLDKDGNLRTRFREIRFDSLRDLDYARKLFRTELGSAISRFIDGYMHDLKTVSDTLVIGGVLQTTRDRHVNTESVIIPVQTALEFNPGGFSGDPADLFSALSSGRVSFDEGASGGKTFSKVTLDLDPRVSPKTVRDSVEALGFRSFSFAEQFDEIRQFFLYFDLILGVIGFIALFTASLGIVNTMVMSITERRREIGVLKSLGADDRDIRYLFLAESGAIGSIGAIVGIFIGWMISRIASAIAAAIMAKEGVHDVELFALPWWLILIAFSFGLIVSLIAGYYPAVRAARVDPVQALRND